MRAMPIRIITGKGGFTQIKASWKKNHIHYLQEAFGLAIFMISACFFGAMLEAKNAALHHAVPNSFVRMLCMALLMGSTALFIFYSPFTAPSGSHINPAVTLSFLRLGKMCPWDASFYILFQFIGGTLAVYIMRLMLGEMLTMAPVNTVATVPGKGLWPAVIAEFITAFITMTMVLFTSHHTKLKKYTRVFAACLVFCWVILAGPVSGFGMNPARTFASALPAHIWTGIWIYLFTPVAGMLSATECFMVIQKRKQSLLQVV